MSMEPTAAGARARGAPMDETIDPSSARTVREDPGLRSDGCQVSFTEPTYRVCLFPRRFFTEQCVSRFRIHVLVIVLEGNDKEQRQWRALLPLLWISIV